MKAMNGIERSDGPAARTAGALFLLAMAASLAGGGLLESVVSKPDYREAILHGGAPLAVGIVLEFVNALAVVGIASVLVPFLRKRNESAALAYYGFRLLEAASCILAAFVPVLLYAVLKGSPQAGMHDGNIDVVRALLLVTRAEINGVLVPLFFCLGAFLFYLLAFRVTLFPRFISAWGLAAVVAVFASNFLPLPPAVRIALALPIILNEIFLGVWLLVKGFDTRTAGG